MSDQDSASNNNVVDLSARRNSSINMEGYSLLPDLIWTPSPEMMKSQYGKVIFTNVRESYSATEDLLCTYTIMKEQEVRNDDRVAIFCVGWTRIDQVITWVPAALRPSAMEDLSVIFPAAHLPSPSTRFYQFCYLNGGDIRGASVPFYFVNRSNVTAEHLQKELYFRNHPVLSTAAPVNNVSIGDECLRTVPGGSEHNFTLSSSGCRSNVIQPGYSSGVLEIATAPAPNHDSSSSEANSNHQYIPNKKIENLPSTSGIPPAVAVQPVPTCPGIPSRSRNSDEDESHEDAESTYINNELQRKVLELQQNRLVLEQDKMALTAAVSYMNEANISLKTSLDDVKGKHQTMSHMLQKAQSEVERQIQQRDVDERNHAVVVRELETEIYMNKLKISELMDKVSEKDRIIAYYRDRYGEVTIHATAFHGDSVPPLPNPEESGDSDGQFEQQGHVGIGASSGMQRQDVRTSTRSPFFAALRKTRNYYITFLSDKADIEQKLFNLSCSKLDLVKKLCKMRDRKESILRQEYRYFCALERMNGAQSDEMGRMLEAISEARSKIRELNRDALFEVGVIDEIKNRFEINMQNICTLKVKAIEVFYKFLQSYYYSMERNSGATQTEVEHIQNLYAGLDQRFQNLLFIIYYSTNNTFIWK